MLYNICMYRLSLIISEVYNKYLPLAEKGRVALNLDFSDTTKTVDDPEAIKADLEKHLGSALDRSVSGEVSIAVESDAIIITDSGTTLSKPLCSLLSRGRVNVTSRVGFGTTVRISLLPPPDQSNDTPVNNVPSDAKSAIIAQETAIQTESTVKKPKPSSGNRTTAKKLTREQRKLIAAAKKADRKIQKLRKSQQKSIKKSATKNTVKKPKPATKKPVKTSSKTAQKSRKKVIELS